MRHVLASSGRRAAVVAADVTAVADTVGVGGVTVVAVLLVYEHLLVRPDDLTRVNQAFFHVNTVISLGLFAVILVQLAVNP